MTKQGEQYLIVGVSTVAILTIVGIVFRKPIVAYIKSFAKSVLTAQQEYYISDLNTSKGVQDLFRRFITEVRKKGWRTIITSGYRTFAEQAALYKENSSNAPPGYSTHNFGLGIDINLENAETGQILKKSSSKQEWLDSGIPQLAKKMGLKWGGYDNDAEYKSSFSGYFDPVHFEIPIPTAPLLAKAKAKYGSDVTKIIGNEIKIT